MNWFANFMRWMLGTKASTPVPPAVIPPVIAAPRLVMSIDADLMFTCAADDRERVNFGERGRSPSWAAGGDIIFATADGRAIKIMAAAGRNARTIGQLNHLSGIFRPQMVGDTILFSAAEQGSAGSAWVMRGDGSGLRKLTQAGCAPAFLSPDGKWATFTRETPGPPMHRQIWRINIDGSDERQVTFGDDPAHPDGNASAISPDGMTIAIFWGPEDFGTNPSPTGWGQRDLAEVPASGGTPKVIVAATPAMQPGFPGNYPPLPALLAADNPAPYRDPAGLDWWIFDGGRPDAEGGTFKVRLGGGPITRLSRHTRGAGNVPMR